MRYLGCCIIIKYMVSFIKYFHLHGIEATFEFLCEGRGHDLVVCAHEYGDGYAVFCNYGFQFAGLWYQIAEGRPNTE